MLVKRFFRDHAEAFRFAIAEAERLGLSHAEPTPTWNGRGSVWVGANGAKVTLMTVQNNHIVVTSYDPNFTLE